MEQQAALDFLAQQNTLSPTSEQGRVSYTPWVQLYGEGSMDTLLFQNQASTRQLRTLLSANLAEDQVNSQQVCWRVSFSSPQFHSLLASDDHQGVCKMCFQFAEEEYGDDYALVPVKMSYSLTIP